MRFMSGMTLTKNCSASLGFPATAKPSMRRPRWSMNLSNETSFKLAVWLTSSALIRSSFPLLIISSRIYTTHMHSRPICPEWVRSFYIDDKALFGLLNLDGFEFERELVIKDAYYHAHVCSTSWGQFCKDTGKKVLKHRILRPMRYADECTYTMFQITSIFILALQFLQTLADFNNKLTSLVAFFAVICTMHRKWLKCRCVHVTCNYLNSSQKRLIQTAVARSSEMSTGMRSRCEKKNCDVWS